MVSSNEPSGIDPAAVQENITSYWHVHAVAYDEHPLSQIHMGPARDAWKRVWQSGLPPAPADVLDVGAGTGQVSLPVAELGYRVTGIDLAEGMLHLARAKAEGMSNPPVFRLGDAVAPPFPPASFDAITCRYLLWTLREPLQALTNWRHLLRPGGRLVAVDSTWYAGGIRAHEREEYQDHDEFLRLYDERVVAALPLAEVASIDAMAALVREAGFVAVHVTPLEEIERLERELRPHTGIDVQLQFLITARKDDA